MAYIGIMYQAQEVTSAERFISGNQKKYKIEGDGGMIVFIFKCPHCGIDDYQEVMIEDTNYIELCTCKSCKEAYTVRIDVVTHDPRKAREYVG